MTYFEKPQNDLQRKLLNKGWCYSLASIHQTGNKIASFLNKDLMLLL